MPSPLVSRSRACSPRSSTGHCTAPPPAAPALAAITTGVAAVSPATLAGASSWAVTMTRVPSGSRMSRAPSSCIKPGHSRVGPHLVAPTKTMVGHGALAGRAGSGSRRHHPGGSAEHASAQSGAVASEKQLRHQASCRKSPW
eukprot:scaffold637_cov118-Isochrysis_galbana.AAC.7